MAQMSKATASSSSAQQHAGMPVVGRQVVVQLGKDGLWKACSVIWSRRTQKETVACRVPKRSQRRWRRVVRSRAVAEPVLSVFIDRAGEAKLVYESRVDYPVVRVRQFVKMCVATLSTVRFCRSTRWIYGGAQPRDLRPEEGLPKGRSELPGTLLADQKKAAPPPTLRARCAYQHTAANVYWFRQQDVWPTRTTKQRLADHVEHPRLVRLAWAAAVKNAAWIP